MPHPPTCIRLILNSVICKKLTFYWSSGCFQAWVFLAILYYYSIFRSTKYEMSPMIGTLWDLHTFFGSNKNSFRLSIILRWCIFYIFMLKSHYLFLTYTDCSLIYVIRKWGLLLWLTVSITSSYCHKINDQSISPCFYSLLILHYYCLHYCENMWPSTRKPSIMRWVSIWDTGENSCPKRYLSFFTFWYRSIEESFLYTKICFVATRTLL